MWAVIQLKMLLNVLKKMNKNNYDSPNVWWKYFQYGHLCKTDTRNTKKGTDYIVKNAL